MMTTTGAILGALPLAIGLGEGSELRQPLGISIVGGLFLSQILTLYTTPVVFLYMDRFGDWTSGFWNRWYHGIMGDKPGDHAPSAVAGGVAHCALPAELSGKLTLQRSTASRESIAGSLGSRRSQLQIRQIVRARRPCRH